MARWELRIEEPEQSVRSVDVQPGLTVGRHPDNKVVLTDAKTSGHHGAIRVDNEGQLVYADLGSMNKSRVDGGPALDKDQTVVVRDGLKLYLGRTTLIFIDREKGAKALPGTMMLEDSDRDPVFAEMSTVRADSGAAAAAAAAKAAAEKAAAAAAAAKAAAVKESAEKAAAAEAAAKAAAEKEEKAAAAEAAAKAAAEKEQKARAAEAAAKAAAEKEEKAREAAARVKIEMEAAAAAATAKAAAVREAAAAEAAAKAAAEKEEKAAAAEAAAKAAAEREVRAAAEKAAAEKAAAEKAAAEKAALEKAAADKAALEKAAARRIAAEKAAAEAGEAEKVAVEKRAVAERLAREQLAEKSSTAERPIAEQASAVKGTAEQQAAESAAADKAALESAAAAKLAAEKVIAEKAATEKALAEKLAAEKAAAEKAAAEKAEVAKAAAAKAAAAKVEAAKAASAEKPPESVGDGGAVKGPAAKAPPPPKPPPVQAPLDVDSTPSAATVFAGAMNQNVGELASLAQFRLARPRLIIASEAIREVVPIKDQEMVIGRSNRADKKIGCRLNHDAVSSVHASIKFERARFFIRDLESRNGTFLGTEMLAPNTAREIAADHHIRFGTIDALFVSDTEPGGGAVPPKRYVDALGVLVSDGIIPELLARRVQADAKEKNVHPGELLLVESRITVAQWCDAIARGPFINVGRRAQSKAGSGRFIAILVVILLLAGLAAAWSLKPEWLGLR